MEVGIKFNWTSIAVRNICISRGISSGRLKQKSHSSRMMDSAIVCKTSQRGDNSKFHKKNSGLSSAYLGCKMF